MTDDGEKVFLCGVTCANNNYLRVCAHEKTLELSSVICHVQWICGYLPCSGSRP